MSDFDLWFNNEGPGCDADPYDPDAVPCSGCFEEFTRGTGFLDHESGEEFCSDDCHSDAGEAQSIDRLRYT